MDEIVYSLLLKTAPGLAVLGTLRYRFSSTNPANPVGADVASVLSQVQQQTTLELTAFQIDGSVTIPLITGLRPVPITGIALITFLGPPVTTLASSTDPARNLFLQFNQLDNNHIGGGLVWRPGEPGQLIFSVLGTQLPA
ncbi:MAG: hypothetical protein ABW069_04535 [Duganella sp.]